MNENEIDVQIGRKLRSLRNMRGVSQGALAKQSGITFQQIQKYEKGINRISAARLFDFSQILGTDVAYFFKDLVSGTSAKVSKKFSFAEDEDSAFVKQSLFESRETSTLVREYYKIKDAAKRKHVLEIIKAMSGK